MPTLPFKLNQDRRHHIPKQKHKLTNSAAYDASVARSILKAGLVEEIPAENAKHAWRTEAGEGVALRATEAGLALVRVETPGPECAPATSETVEELPMPALATADPDVAVSLPPPHGSQRRLQAAVEAVIAAWDTDGHNALPDAMAAMRAVLVGQPRPQRRTEPLARAPRADTKQAGVLALLRRREGASGPQMIEATGWAPHTVRGFLAGLAKRGITVEVLERVRQIQGGKGSARGSYTVYRIAGEG